jgi:hypothetical protein
MGIVKAEETVIVIDMRGRRVKGVLTAVDKDSVSLATDGRTQTFARSEVSTVRVADGFGNGALIGAGAGLGTALGILAIAGSGDRYAVNTKAPECDQKQTVEPPLRRRRRVAFIHLPVREHPSRSHRRSHVVEALPFKTEAYCGVFPPRVATKLTQSP